MSKMYSTFEDLDLQVPLNFLTKKCVLNNSSFVPLVVLTQEFEVFITSETLEVSLFMKTEIKNQYDRPSKKHLITH